MSNTIDTEYENDILTPEEVARYLRKSTSWVYKNWKILGGRKLGGSLFFPRKEAEAKQREKLKNPKMPTPTEQTRIDIDFLELVNKRLDHVKAYNSERHYGRA